jgi:hypothetical protein
MGDETHAAGVMFVGGVVQTLGFWAMSLNHGSAWASGFVGGEINPIPRFLTPGLGLYLRFLAASSA